MRDAVAVGLWLGHMAFFHSAALCFAHLDRSRALWRYKVYKEAMEPLTYRVMLPTILRNQAVLLLLLLLCARAGLLRPSFDAPFGSPWVLPRAALSLVGFGYAHDLLMYLAHRFVLHHAWFYARWHALHHRTKASVAASALYMTVPDFLLEVVVPFAGWFLAFPTEHVLVYATVMCGGAVLSMYEHSGYRVPWVPRCLGDPTLHAEHHRRLAVAFSEGMGSPGCCDRVLGTAAGTARARQSPGRAGPGGCGQED